MKADTTIIPFRQSDSIDDPLTGLAREGARRMVDASIMPRIVSDNAAHNRR